MCRSFQQSKTKFVNINEAFANSCYTRAHPWEVEKGGGCTYKRVDWCQSCKLDMIIHVEGWITIFLNPIYLSFKNTKI